MTHLFSRQRSIILVVIIILLISSACTTPGRISPGATQIAPSGTLADSPTESAVISTPDGAPNSIEGDLNFGTGPFNFPDTRAGLADLTSYTATLTLSFDGIEAGQPNKWSKTYVMLYGRDPSLRQLTIEKTVENSTPDQVYMAEVDGAVYEQRGTNACFANVITEGNSLTERFEPAGFLNGVIGADEAGAETVNDAVENHYSFDERAFGQTDVAQSKGELWVASAGGYIVRYLLTTNGGADYFGEGIEGTITWDYELTNINQPVTVTLPEDCPPGLVNAPLLPDVANELNMPGILTYETSTSLLDIAAFYQKELPALGWVMEGEPTITDDTILLDYSQGEKTVSVIATNNENGTKVHVLLGKVIK
jgi:hypothetical protein